MPGHCRHATVPRHGSTQPRGPTHATAADLGLQALPGSGATRAPAEPELPREPPYWQWHCDVDTKTAAGFVVYYSSSA